MNQQQKKVVLDQINKLVKDKAAEINLELDKLRNAVPLPNVACSDAVAASKTLQADIIKALVQSLKEERGTWEHDFRVCRYCSTFKRLYEEKLQAYNDERARIDGISKQRQSLLNEEAEELKLLIVLEDIPENIVKLLKAFTSKKY